MEAFVQNALKLRTNLSQLRHVCFNDLNRLHIAKTGVVFVCQHLHQKFRVHSKHSRFEVQVIVKVVVSLVTKLHFFQVNFDPDIRYEYILQSYRLLQCVCRAVGHVPECVQQLFCPVLKQRLVVDQSFAPMGSHYIQQRLSFLNLEKVLVKVRICLIIKAQIAWCVLAQNQFFRSTNLVEELSKIVKVLKVFRNLIARHGCVPIAAVCQFFHYSGIVLFQQLYWLFAVVHRSDSSTVKFFFQ